MSSSRGPLINRYIYVDLPFHLAEFLAARVAKDRRGSPLYGGVLITRLALSFGVLEKREAIMLTVEPQKPFLCPFV